MKLQQLILASLASAGLVSALPAAATEKTQSKAPVAQPAQSEGEVEAQLAAARQRLEDAARDVAELSGQLTDPVTRDFIFSVQGMPSRAMLGVNMASGSNDKEGVRIESVTPGGPAAAAGIKAGDVLTAIDEVNLRDSAEPPSRLLIDHMRKLEPGEKVKVSYVRDGKTQTAEITTQAMGGIALFGPGDRMFNVPAPPPVAGVPPAPGAPFTMAFGSAAFADEQMLDMEFVTLSPKLGKYFGTDHGVLVVRPAPDSQLKLEEGDVILDIDGRTPQSGQHALRILRSYQPGEKLTLNVLRDRKAMKLAVTVPRTRGGNARAMWLEHAPPTLETLPKPITDDNST